MIAVSLCMTATILELKKLDRQAKMQAEAKAQEELANKSNTGSGLHRIRCPTV